MDVKGMQDKVSMCDNKSGKSSFPRRLVSQGTQAHRVELQSTKDRYSISKVDDKVSNDEYKVKLSSKGEVNSTIR